MQVATIKTLRGKKLCATPLINLQNCGGSWMCSCMALQIKSWNCLKSGSDFCILKSVGLPSISIPLNSFQQGDSMSAIDDKYFALGGPNGFLG